MAKKQKEEADLGGYYARDTHRGGFGDNYARDDEKARTAPESGKRGRKVQQRPIGKASE
ncbi:MAG TPA: hypothetical protein VGR02_15100 [Thermoanaerobaculia bacterium]|jgi:hypothetical protein|nr:hypothetical protein [Thermoanaerobaculia bacterium]